MDRCSAQLGVLSYTDVAKLHTRPNGSEHCVANYSPDRIVFHIEGKPNEVVAQVSLGFPCPCIYFFDPDEYPIL